MHFRILHVIIRLCHQLNTFIIIFCLPIVSFQKKYICIYLVKYIFSISFLSYIFFIVRFHEDYRQWFGYHICKFFFILQDKILRILRLELKYTKVYAFSFKNAEAIIFKSKDQSFFLIKNMHSFRLLLILYNTPQETRLSVLSCSEYNNKNNLGCIVQFPITSVNNINHTLKTKCFL